MKTALIFGVTGQDGSYLAEFLLEKNYKVYGVARRVSTGNNYERIKHIVDENFVLIEGDVTDPHSVNAIILLANPDEVYNLAAQSHVRTSFDQPIYTWNATAGGTLNILEGIRQLAPKARYYQAGSSEMFGSSLGTLYGSPPKGLEFPDGIILPNAHYKQDENTPFMPCSPYGVAKLAAHHMTRIYRDGYKLFTCNGILFNHETLAGIIPVIFTDDDGQSIDIKPISEVAKYHTGISINENVRVYQSGNVVNNLKVWDKSGWTKVKFASGYPHQGNKAPRWINARNFVYMATSSHQVFMSDNTSKATKDIIVGDKLALIDYPSVANISYEVNEYEAELLGILVGDGNVSRGVARVAGKCMDRAKLLWKKISGHGDTYYYPSKSGFNKDSTVGYIDLRQSKIWVSKFAIYNEDKTKRIPKEILNASTYVKEHFIKGYYAADGLKSKRSKYPWSNFKTNSATLAAGLLYILNEVTGQRYNITIEESFTWHKPTYYYSVNLLSNLRSNIEKYEQVKALLLCNTKHREISRSLSISRNFVRKIKHGYVPNQDHHLLKDKREVKKIIDVNNYSGWFYDLETESGTFHCGIGQGYVHNSPRRCDTFFTRKVTKYIAKLFVYARRHADLKLWTQARYEHFLDGVAPLKLGNLSAYRDWGWAPDFVRAMWLMLQQDKPDDYVIATGETHSAKEFLVTAFEYALGYYSDRFVEIDPSLCRVVEVDYLCGNYSKAKQLLGWEPQIGFQDIVRNMASSDIIEESKKAGLDETEYEFLTVGEQKNDK